MLTKKSVGFAPKDLPKELGVRQVDLENGLTEILDPYYGGGSPKVTSVNGQTGDVVLTASDIPTPEGNVGEVLTVLSDGIETFSSTVSTYVATYYRATNITVLDRGKISITQWVRDYYVQNKSGIAYNNGTLEQGAGTALPFAGTDGIKLRYLDNKPMQTAHIKVMVDATVAGGGNDDLDVMKIDLNYIGSSDFERFHIIKEDSAAVYYLTGNTITNLVSPSAPFVANGLNITLGNFSGKTMYISKLLLKIIVV